MNRGMLSTDQDGVNNVLSRKVETENGFLLHFIFGSCRNSPFLRARDTVAVLAGPTQEALWLPQNNIGDLSIGGGVD